MHKKYKYLDYIPAPVNLDPALYDLVDDKEFCKPDDRIPLLLATQFGIFPGGNYPGKKDYSHLVGLENQVVGFIGRAYPTEREREGILAIFLDQKFLLQIECGHISIGLSLWYYRKKFIWL